MVLYSLQGKSQLNISYGKKSFTKAGLYAIIRLHRRLLRQSGTALEMEITIYGERKDYVAYVSTYTQGDSIHGIKIYDVDMKHGRFIEKDKVEITNSSYVTISHNGKYLYSITDFGVEAYNILKDGIWS